MTSIEDFTIEDIDNYSHQEYNFTDDNIEDNVSLETESNTNTDTNTDTNTNTNTNDDIQVFDITHNMIGGAEFEEDDIQNSEDNEQVVLPTLNIKSNSSSFDPEADTEPEPEANVESKPESKNNSVQVVNVVKSVNSVDPFSDLPEGEFIIDDDDFVMQEIKNDIKIIEEEIIPEEKIIANEKEQNDDLLNEITRKLPDKMKENKSHLKKIFKQLQNYKNLKNDYSIKDPNDIFKLTPNLKGDNYIKNVTNILDGDFESENLIPILNSKNNLYELPNTDDLNFDNNLEEIPLDNFNKMDNENEILKFVNTRENYRKGKNRINYSYKNEFNTYDSYMNIYKAKNDILNLKTNKDLFAFRNCFEQECYYYNNSKISKSLFDKHLVEADYYTNSDRNGPLTEAKQMDIAGFVRIPKSYLKINKLNVDNLNSVLNDSYSYNELYNNLSNHTIENINLDLEKGKKVKLCFNVDNEKTNIDGIIEEITESTYVIKTINVEEDIDDKTLEIEKKDKNVKILNIENGKRNCLLDDENMFKIFLFDTDNEEIVNKRILKKYLKNIIPTTKEVLSTYSDVKTLDEVLNNLKYHNLTLEDITFNNFKNLIDKLREINTNLAEKADIEEREFEKYIKNMPREVRKNITFINNKMLNDLKSFYGEYPYFNKSIDSILTRLQWLYSRPDNGLLFFKNIVRNIKEKINYDPEKMIQSTSSKLYKLEGQLFDIENEITLERNKLVQEKNDCLEYRIVKTYSSIEELEADSQKDITIDDDKIMYGEGTNLVQVGQFALLDIPNQPEKKLFKRVKLANGDDIWTLEKSGNLDHILKTNKDFCEQQLKNLEEINSSILYASSCKYSDIEKSCIPKELDRKIHKKEGLKVKIEQMKDSLAELQDSIKYSDKVETRIKQIEQYLNLFNVMEEKKYKNIERDLEDENLEEVDPRYEELYKKIDLYLEKIAPLKDSKRYALLEPLVNKYGREYNPSSIKAENPNNVYCKFGYKVLCCKHDIMMIDVYNKPELFTEKMDKVISEFGVENDGIQWCKNCGREINIGEYETIEGFKKTGARDVTTEVLVEDEYVSKYENVELFESLKKYLDEDNKNDSTLGIITILKAILSIIGIKLSDKDELKVVTEASNLCKTNIKSKTDWLPTYKGKPKKADKYYQNYQDVNTIFYTTSILFIILQISIPEYKLTKPHAKCKTSLDGVPLNDSNKNGIKYLACVLETLRETSSSWECLKKIKIPDVLETTVLKLAKDDFYQKKYKEKNDFIMKQKVLNINKKKKNIWNEFKPPLEIFEVENTKFDKLSLKDMSNKRNKDELNTYYSLKIMSSIDYQVNDSPVENYLFHPTPLGNSCCIDNINPEYNYLSTFAKDKTIEKLLDYSHKLDNDIHINDKSQISTNNYKYESLISFRNQIYPNSEDITQEEVMKLYETFISDIGNNHLGKKHVYDNNRCLYTGEKRSDITSKTYTNDDYFELLRTINSKRLMNVTHEDTHYDVLSELTLLVDTNNILKNDKYMNQFLNLLVETKDKIKIDQLWGDFDEQIKVEVNELVSLLEDIVPKQSKKLKSIIENFGKLEKINEELKAIYNDLSQDKINCKKIEMINQYIYIISNIIFKVKSDSYSEDIEISDIPKNWKIQPSYYENLKLLLKKDNEIVEKYIIIKRDEKKQILFNQLSELSNTIKKCTHLLGEDHVYNCDMSVNKYSKFTNKNLGLFMHYILITFVKNILEIQSSSSIFKNINVKTDKKTFSDEESVVVKSESELVNDETDTDTEIVQKKSKSMIEEEDESQTSVMLGNFVIDILNNIEKVQQFHDQHTQKHISEVIEKKTEMEKEENLKFIEELDKESRQSLKSMITIGIDTWKNLSKKEDKNLYFGESIAEVDEGVTDTNILQYTEEEMEELNRQHAQEELGENYSEEQYQEFLERRENSRQEDIQAQMDRDIMKDDDGDGDIGPEDEDEF